MPFDSVNLTTEQRNGLELADFVGNTEHIFSMRWNGSDDSHRRGDCETPGCILGHAGALWPEEVSFRHGRGVFLGGDPTKAEAKLGLTVIQGHHLFFSPFDKEGRNVEFNDINQHMAAAAVRRAVLTGEVWFDTAEAGP